MVVMGCEQLREVAPDVALGLLTGEERAAALAHLDGCESCRADVASLAGVVDEVLLAGPEAAPPPGFASGVLARVAGERAGREAPAGTGAAAPATSEAAPAPARHGRRRRGAVVALAAAAVLVLVAGLGLMLRSGGDPEPVVATAEMRTGRGEVVGEATVTGDETASVTVEVPGWEAMVDRWGASGDEYWVAVETVDGARAMRPAATGGDGEDWSVTVDVAAEDVSTVAVLDAEGRVWCSGRFPT